MSNESAPKYDLSGGPSAEFGNDGSKMGHRDYTEWRKAGGSHDEFMQYMYDNPHMQGKGTHLVAELEEHGQNRDFRESDINPENTDYGWLGWDNANSDVGYDLLEGEEPEKPEAKQIPITDSPKVAEAKERVQNYKETYLDFKPGEHPFYRYGENYQPNAATESAKTNSYNEGEAQSSRATRLILNKQALHL